MLNKLTVDKINKILEYCKYTKQLTTNTENEVIYRVEMENAYETEAEEHALRIYRRKIHIVISIGRPLHNAIYQAVYAAQEHSQNYNCLSSVKVWIETRNSEGELIDEDPIDEYEINFENGNEV